MFPSIPSDSTHKHILITDELKTDGTFLLHHFMGIHLKKPTTNDTSDALLAGKSTADVGVVFVGLKEGLGHYETVARKLVSISRIW
jgi:hypothetical protein